MTSDLRDEITALRAQVEALKEGAASLHKAYARGRSVGVRAGLAAAVRACTLVEVAHREKGGLYTSAVGDRDCALTIAEIDPDEVDDA